MEKEMNNKILELKNKLQEDTNDLENKKELESLQKDYLKKQIKNWNKKSKIYRIVNKYSSKFYKIYFWVTILSLIYFIFFVIGNINPESFFNDIINKINSFLIKK